jgi:YegS/Rv2252/BmrU family lipid kinase
VIAEAAVRDGAEIVVVQGGDGTTMQAAAALVGTDVALGIVPGGTGNLLAGNLRIPASIRGAARVLTEGRRRRIDLGRMARAEGLVYFSVAAGAGIDALVMEATPAASKQRWGMGAYVAATIRKIPEIRSHPYVITVDGRSFEAEAALVIVANCGEVFPPFVRLGPGISPEDGLLDLIVVRADGLWDSLKVIWQVVRDLPAERRVGSLIGYARGRVIRVEATPPQPVEMDGEAHGQTPFTAEAVPGAITVLAPGA